ncbi:MAG TPA: 30S ribosomal protein S6 [Anaerolineae bacterium]|nr:30S ribosomal protein S6 [Anaerolineae bacterium]
MNDYEITIIYRNDMDEAVRTQLLERVLGWLTAANPDGAAPAVDHWGDRQLAYEINKQKIGHYVFYQANLDPAKLADFERNLMYADGVLRHMVIRKED